MTIANLRTTAHAAIRQHHQEAGLCARMNIELIDIAAEPWATRIWYRDPRITNHVPKGDATVYDIATSGSLADRRFLFDRIDGLRAAIESQPALVLSAAVAQYVEAISGQSGERLEVLLARSGLNGRDPITAAEAGRILCVSCQRIYQLEQQLANHRIRAGSPAGVWMPQVIQAQATGWPDGYTDSGLAAITAFVSPQ